jgi:tryptophan synthase alpha chain
MTNIGIRGAIVPDLPPEEGATYLEAMQQRGLDPIFIFSPSTTDQRLRMIAANAGGFVYCVARKGVTGKDTDFSSELGTYLARCRRATDLPLALGFGVRNRRDLDFLRNKVDIAVVGSETIRIMDRDGLGAIAPFIRQLVEP